MKLIYSTFFTMVFSASALAQTKISGTAKVEIYKEIGVTNIRVSGVVAKRLFNELNVEEVLLQNGTIEKTGEDLSCRKEVRSYTCGINIVNETGESSPDQGVGPFPGFSIGN